MLPLQLQNLIQQFTKLPGIGPRQAARFIFYLLRNKNEISTLLDTLKSVNESIKLCQNCFLPSQTKLTGSDPVNLCNICASPRRDKNTICIVEKETDALNVEKTGQFMGHYYILGGFIDPLERDSLAYERLNILLQKLNTTTKELILAFTPRREGDFTSLYIEEQLKPLKEHGVDIKTTRLGRGLSSGAELEYADEETLKNALAGRR
ncbi:MAG: recombination mediator RecR [Candidatus Spechtbacterales bacterium]